MITLPTREEIVLENVSEEQDDRLRDILRRVDDVRVTLMSLRDYHAMRLVILPLRSPGDFWYYQHELWEFANNPDLFGLFPTEPSVFRHSVMEEDSHYAAEYGCARWLLHHELRLKTADRAGFPLNEAELDWWTEHLACGLFHPEQPTYSFDLGSHLGYQRAREAAGEPLRLAGRRWF